jgi:hypothetical protein
MARQNIHKGTVANDGTGDTLRSAAGKINDNFVELYTLLGGDSAQVTQNVSLRALLILVTPIIQYWDS